MLSWDSGKLVMKICKKFIKIIPTPVQAMPTPHDIAVTKDGKYIFVAQLRPHRIFKVITKSDMNVLSQPRDDLMPKVMFIFRRDNNNDKGKIS